MCMCVGTDSNVRAIYEDAVDVDAVSTSEGKLQFKTADASTIYVGVKPAHPGAGCLVKYTTGKRTTKHAKMAVVTRTTSGECRRTIYNLWNSLLYYI